MTIRAKPVNIEPPSDIARPSVDIALARPIPVSTSLTRPHVHYSIPDSDPPLSLTFWKFGTAIPEMELFTALARAGGYAFKMIQQNGSASISHGFLKYEFKFEDSRDSIIVTISDLSEIGRQLNWFMVRDAIRGVGLYMNDHEHAYLESSFWIELNKLDEQQRHDVFGVPKSRDVGFGSVAFHHHKYWPLDANTTIITSTESPWTS